MESESQLSSEELQQWQLSLEEANRHNIWCHCRECDFEWGPLPKSLANVVASGWSILPVGNSQMISACWQFPDD